MEKMIGWINSKLWMPYVLGGRWNGKIACSGLIWSFALYSEKDIDKKTYLNNLNAQSIYWLTKQKDVKDIIRWDLVFWKQWTIKHIAIITKVNLEEGRILVTDATPWNWVSMRTIYLAYDEAWKIVNYRNPTRGKYELLFAYNPFAQEINITEENKWEFLWEFSVTSYIPGNGDPINSDKDYIHTASWLPLKDEYAWKVVACPKKFAFGTKLLIDWHGEVVCKDRWGLITMAWEKNSRGNIAKESHLDLFAWLGTPKIARAKSTRKVYFLWME
jgi:hypothetical protein